MQDDLFQKTKTSLVSAGTLVFRRETNPHFGFLAALCHSPSLPHQLLCSFKHKINLIRLIHNNRTQVLLLGWSNSGILVGLESRRFSFLNKTNNSAKKTKNSI